MKQNRSSGSKQNVNMSHDVINLAPVYGKMWQLNKLVITQLNTWTLTWELLNCNQKVTQANRLIFNYWLSIDEFWVMGIFATLEQEKTIGIAVLLIN